MIKDMVKRTLMLAAIIIFTVFFVSFLTIGATPEILLVFEIFLLSFFIIFIQQLLKQFVCPHFLWNVIIEYLAISGFVLLYGYYVRWFFRENWWMVFLYVAVVYVPAYFLDMAIIKKDINYINRQLEKRRENDNSIENK